MTGNFATFVANAAKWKTKTHSGQFAYIKKQSSD